MPSPISEGLGIDLKSSDILAFILLFASSVGAIFFAGFLWVENIGWRHLWLLGFLLFVLILVLGYLFAKYALHPLAKQSSELERLLKDTLHELNIPVATIKANVGMLRRNLKEEKSVRRLNRINMAADQLLELYKQIDYEIQQNIKRVQKERFDISQLIEERLLLLEELLGDKKVIKRLDPIMVEISKQGCVKVIDNLLSNAIKYTPRDGLIEIIAKDGHIVIKDNGIGMEESELIKIFDRYYRATDQAPGYGIGLNIVKNICDQEGIGISIHSKKGEGTSVKLELKKVMV